MNPTSSVRWTWLLVVVATIIVPSSAAEDSTIRPLPAWVAEYGYQSKDLVDFAFGDPGVPEVPIVTVTIQGSTFPLIFDTGTNGYASLDSDVIARLQIPVKSWNTWLDSSGKPVARIPRVVVPSLQFGPISLTDAEVIGMGPESIMGRRLGYVGTLGWWSFRDYRITLDYANRKIAFSRSPLPPNIQSCATRYISGFVSPSDLNGLVLVEGEVSGKPIYLEVDTGKSSTELDPKIESIRKFEKESQGYRIEGITVGPFMIQSRLGRMFAGFESFGRGLDKPVYVGLGSDFLKNFLLTIDYRSRRVVLQQKACELLPLVQK